jgi:type II secretory pathway pseudopilin PulG
MNPLLIIVILGAAVIPIIAIIAAIAIPGLLASQRAANERNAMVSLKTLSSAEADFQANDRDDNKVNDFWTGDVSGLYTVKPAGGGAELRLIEERVANADAKPLFPQPKGTIPMAGHLFQALDRDDFVGGPEGEYRRDTDKSGRKVHHEKIFGFCAFPKSGSDGKYVFFTNQDNTIFRTRAMEPRTSFPSDDELKRILSWD